MESVLGEVRCLWLSLELGEVAGVSSRLGMRWRSPGSGRRRWYGARAPLMASVNGGERNCDARPGLTSGTGEEVGSVVRQRWSSADAGVASVLARERNADELVGES